MVSLVVCLPFGAILRPHICVICCQVLRAVILSLLTRYWRSIPVARHFAAPVMLFFTAERLLGTNHAAMLGGLALWPPLAPWIIVGLDLWRTRYRAS